MLNINLTQNILISYSLYVKLTIGYIKNSAQKF